MQEPQAIKDIKSFYKLFSLKKMLLYVLLGVIPGIILYYSNILPGHYEGTITMKPHYNMAEDVFFDCSEWAKRFNKNPMNGVAEIAVDEVEGKGINQKRRYGILFTVRTKDSIELNVLNDSIERFCNSRIHSGRSYKGREVLKSRLALIDSCLKDSARGIENKLKSKITIEWEELNLQSYDNLVLMKGRYLGELRNLNTINYLNRFEDNYGLVKHPYKSSIPLFSFAPLLLYILSVYFRREFGFVE